MNGMKPTIRAVRAIGAEFIRRAIKPILLAGAGALAVSVALGIWLVVAVSAWWWLLLAPILFVAVVFTVLAIIVRVAVKLADSVQNREQKAAVTGYVDRLQRVAENLQTPQFVILYRVVRDVVQPRPDGFIATMSRDSRTLAPDFKQLVALFG